MRESRIQGQAVAIFGGQIGIRVGYNKDSGYAVLCLCELVEDHKPGDKLEKGWDSYGEQIQLAFKDLKSINIVRTALDYVERTIKDGKLPGEWLDEDEK